MNTELPYDISAAQEYFASLAPAPVPLSITAPEDLRTQPTIGTAAAGLLSVLVHAYRPARILELGTSWGYSAIALGQAAATYGGRVVSLERNPDLVAVARGNIAKAGLDATVEVREGDARALIGELKGPFGLILQDGGKDDYLPLLNPLVEKLSVGGLLVTDDVAFPLMALPEAVRHWQHAVVEYNQALAAHPRLRTAWLPVGDGIALSLRISS